MVTVECYLGCGRTIVIDNSEGAQLLDEQASDKGWSMDYGTLVFWCNKCEEAEPVEVEAAIPKRVAKTLKLSLEHHRHLLDDFVGIGIAPYSDIDKYNATLAEIDTAIKWVDAQKKE